MDTVPVLSGAIFLRDISADVARLEDTDGEPCPQGERVWVSVRQATESESIRLRSCQSNRVVTQAFLVLTGAGNFTGEDNKPALVFQKRPDYPVYRGSFQEFLTTWNRLQPEVVLAIRDAVWNCNPEWDRRETAHDKPRLRRCLDGLERAMVEWLETVHYDNASPALKRAMNKHALIPAASDAPMPPVYRLWRLCEDNKARWWTGGMANQPQFLMMQFDVCRRAQTAFDKYLARVQTIIKEKE